MSKEELAAELITAYNFRWAVDINFDCVMQGEILLETAAELLT